MKAPYDDCWPPRPGSWEEAVDPYDVQRSRLHAVASRDRPLETRLDTHIERIGDPHAPPGSTVTSFT